MGGSESRGSGEAGPPPKVGDGKDMEADLRAELAQARIDLAQEQRRTRSLEDELRSARERSLAAQKQLEEEEELVTNKLMKRLAGLQAEREALRARVTEEEEHIRRGEVRLREVDAEKRDLQKQLELEQEYVVNKLEKKLNELNAERAKLGRYKVDLENQLEQEQEKVVNRLQRKADRYLDEKIQLVGEKKDLQRHVQELETQCASLRKDKVTLENQMEQEEEHIVNRLQRQLEDLMRRNRELERRADRGSVGGKEKSVSESETSEDETSLFHEHYASFMSKSVKAMHRSQLSYSNKYLRKPPPRAATPPRGPDGRRPETPTTPTKE